MVQLFRKNESGEVESALFNSKRFRSHLGNGWFLDRECTDDGTVKEEVKEVPVDEEFEELQKMARELGCKGWQKCKSSDSLKQMIERAMNDSED